MFYLLFVLKFSLNLGKIDKNKVNEIEKLIGVVIRKIKFLQFSNKDFYEDIEKILTQIEDKTFRILRKKDEFDENYNCIIELTKEMYLKIEDNLFK